MNESSAGGERPAFNVFTFQRRVMPVLLGWAAGSVVAGLVWLFSDRPWLRGLGGQFAGWGLIDGLIAGLGLRGAARNAARLERGELSAAEAVRQAANFEKLLWVNAALDVGYIAAGDRLARRSPDDEFRRGTGRGIMIQGAFLLVWDVILALSVRARRRADREAGA